MEKQRFENPSMIFNYESLFSKGSTEEGDKMHVRVVR